MLVQPALALAVGALALGLAGCGSAGRESAAPSAPRFTVLAHASAPGGYAGDVWAHAGHAYLSSHRGARTCPAQGVRVFDVRNLRRPRLVATFADGRSEPALEHTLTEKTIAIHARTGRFEGDLAVTSVQRCREFPGAFQGFALYDVTRPARPVRLALVELQPRGSHEIWLHAVGDRAYVYTAILASEQIAGRPGFRVYDVSDPRRPREVGSWGAAEKLGIDVSRGRGVRGTAYGDFVHSVITNRAGTLAYLSYWDLGTVILDIADPTKPRYLGRTTFRAGEEGNVHSTWLGRDETLLAETHEATGGTPTLYDVSNPRAPKRLSVFRLPSSVLRDGHRGAARYAPVSGLDLTDSVHDPKLIDGLGYFSWYEQGVVLADLSNPRRPRFLARFRPPPTRDRYGLLCPDKKCTAVWGMYPLSRDTLVVADMLSGLWVVRISRG